MEEVISPYLTEKSRNSCEDDNDKNKLAADDGKHELDLYQSLLQCPSENRVYLVA